MLGVEEETKYGIEGEAIDDNVLTCHVEIITDNSLGYCFVINLYVYCDGNLLDAYKNNDYKGYYIIHGR
jgi:hypothetical protein